MRAIETLISAWIVEQERERVRSRLELIEHRNRPAAPDGDGEREAAQPDLNRA